METVNWPYAIERYRAALLRIADMLIAMAGLADGELPATLPRHLRNGILRILRPAESAARRLIVVAAKGVEAPTLSPRGRESLFPHLRGRSPSKCLEKASEGVGMATTAPNLPLLDTLKRFDFTPRRRYAKSFPRISVIGVTDPRPIPESRLPTPGDPLDATGLCRRLHALKRALDDIPGQAKRLARWQARADLRRKLPDPKPGRNSPMRPGWPPGYRKRPFHEVDDVLRECHSLAALAQKPDTS